MFLTLKKPLLILVTICFLFWFTKSPVRAIYDPTSVPNNRFGIHVLDTSEVGKAAEFANSTGGDWGYITIPIRSNDRDLNKWTAFMNDCRSKHLIPVLRIASFPVGAQWTAPNEWDLIDFANFLDDLPWPTHNRYVIIYNEPNHDSEWGGFVYPEEYARVLDRAIDIFHKRNGDFFVISAGMDSAAPNGPNTENAYQYLNAMNAAYPGIFSRVDGFSSHSYGNPAFTTPPNIYSPQNIANFRYEESFLSTVGVTSPKIFITEAGWRPDLIGDAAANSNYIYAFQNVWTAPNIVAVTPFLLSAESGPFQGFSFTSGENFKPFAKALIALPKTKGQPIVSPTITSPDVATTISAPVGISTQPPLNNPFSVILNRLLSLLKING